MVVGVWSYIAALRVLRLVVAMILTELLLVLVLLLLRPLTSSLVRSSRFSLFILPPFSLPIELLLLLFVQFVCFNVPWSFHLSIYQFCHQVNALKPSLTLEVFELVSRIFKVEEVLGERRSDRLVLRVVVVLPY